MSPTISFQGKYALQGSPQEVYRAYGLIRQQADGHGAPIARKVTIADYVPSETTNQTLDAALEKQVLPETTLYIFSGRDAATFRRKQQHLQDQLRPFMNKIIRASKKDDAQAIAMALKNSRPLREKFDAYLKKLLDGIRIVNATQALQLLEAKEFNLQTGRRLPPATAERKNGQLRMLREAHAAERVCPLRPS